MSCAVKRDAARKEKFWFRNTIMEDDDKEGKDSLMSLDEIINGKVNLL